MEDPPTINGINVAGDHVLRTHDMTLASPPLFSKPTVVKKEHRFANGTTKHIIETTSRTTSELHTSKSETRTTFTKEQQVTVLRETIVHTRGILIAEIDHVDEHYIDFLTIDRFLDYIERERLTHMPQRGSRWDKVLKWTEFFALQISGYSKAVGGFVPDSRDAAKLIWASCRALLELGPENAEALETTFGVFYKLALSISFFLRHNNLLRVTHHIRTEVGQAFNDMLKLVRDVSIHYQVRVHGASYKQVSLDFNAVFGSAVVTFNKRKDHIINLMWDYQLGSEATAEIGNLRTWLSPSDPVVKDVLDIKDHREEYTCEWFQRPLLDFTRSKDEKFEVTGPSGCGKSVLFNWILERLQRPLGKKVYQTASFKFESDISSQITSLALVKSLSLQLLESNVGDSALFKAILHAYKCFTESKSTDKLEDELWKGLEAGFNSDIGKSTNHMVVVDGLNEAKNGQQVAEKIQRHISTLTSKCNNLQFVTLSREATSTNKAKTKSLIITPDHTRDDIRRVAEKAMSGCVHFKDQTDFQKEAIVEQLIHTAKGDFLWVLLTAESLKQEVSHSDFQKAVKKAKESPKSLAELIQVIIGTLDLNKTETGQLLAWLLVAERPLKLSEVKCLLQVDLHAKHLIDRKSDITYDIKTMCGSLVVIENDYVRFRHSVIRQQLAKLQAEAEKLMTWEAAQTDLTSRLLAYCKFILSSTFELVVHLVDVTDEHNLFSQHALLDYAIRTWTLHFRSSSMHKSKDLRISSDFKAIFPSSSYLAILEWNCWKHHASAFEAIDMHTLALEVRQQVFTEKHECVLQSLVICGTLHREISNVTEASTCFYRASTLGQLVLRQYHTFLTTCTSVFLTITGSITSTTRTETVTRRETMIKYIIIASKHQHGKTSDVVIHWYKVLAQLYMEIHEEETAETIYRELREIIIIRHGKGSVEERDISGRLTIVLKKGGKHEDIVEYERNIFEIASVMEIWDERRIKIMVELAISYEGRGEYFLAEEIYVTIWRRLVEHSHQDRHHYGVEIHILTIDMILDYVRFLRRRNRHEEACSVLICIWTSYEEFDFESEVLFLRLKIMGELMRAVYLFEIAISVFRKCWSWFSFHGKQEHCKECEVLISEVTEEIITRTTTTATTTTREITEKTTSETVVKEIFESTISKTTVLTTETIKICKSMISFYMKLEQWPEAIESTRKTLSILWKMIISTGGTCALPRDFSSEAIGIAIDLAICHYRSHHFHEAEEIYIRIYRACRNSCHIHDERMINVYTVLIAFYEEHHHWHKMVEIYQELLIEYRKHLGAKHQRTIEILYILGSLCSEHGHGSFVEYYEEIILVLNGDSAVFHPGAREAMIIICRYYHEEAHWHKLKLTCGVLWETWVHHHHEHSFDPGFIEILYARYRYVLEHHFHCEYEFLRSLSITYRDICTMVFGATVSITIKALIEYASICMRSEKYIHDAITTYEKILTTTTTTTTITRTVETTTNTTTISTETITKIKQRLVDAYTTVCHHGSVDVTTIEKAIKITLEHFEFVKIKFGCANSETLIMCRKLVHLYWKLKTQQSYTAIKRILVDMAVEIITKEKHSRSLNQCAHTLGEIFVTCELSEYGLAMVREMRRQIITGTNSPKDGFSLKIHKAIGRVSYVFLVTLQESLEITVTSRYSVIMAELLTESFLYERYTQCIKASKHIDEIMTHAARLRAFLVKHSRTIQIKPLEDHVFEIFLVKWEATVKTRREITRIFYISLMEELANESITMGAAVCISSNSKVRILLEQGKYSDAFEVASCAFQFLAHQHYYHDLHHVGHGFKLSGLMALRGFKRISDKPLDAKLRSQMLQLSRKIIGDVFKACEDSNINFVRLQLVELNELVELLGDQENYVELEWLLAKLWSSREVQKTWSSETIISIGRRLVQVTCLHNHKPKAIKLCEDICYNLRSLWGALAPQTLEMSDLLCRLYTSAGHYREAMGVHESILRLVIEGDDDDDRTVDAVDSQVAKKHVDGLRQSYLRLGGWDKSAATYKELVDSLLEMEEFKGRKEWHTVQSIDTWNAKDTPNDNDKFVAPMSWEIIHSYGVDERGHQLVSAERPKRPRLSTKRASSNWGMGLIHRFLHGDYDSDDEEAKKEEEPASKALPKVKMYDDDGSYVSGRFEKPLPAAHIVY